MLNSLLILWSGVPESTCSVFRYGFSDLATVLFWDRELMHVFMDFEHFGSRRCQVPNAKNT